MLNVRVLNLKISNIYINYRKTDDLDFLNKRQKMETFFWLGFDKT